MNLPPLQAHRTSATGRAALAAVDDDRQVLQIRFTGAGRGYAQIWASNLLWLLLTLGLYHPFAKARRLRYFHANTLVDGHALGFHGNPWQMLRGFAAGLLLVLVPVSVGVLALRDGQHSRLPQAAGAVAGMLLVALGPALWWASLRARLANTSWRGLRLRFTGDVAGAYRALLPQWLPAAGLLVLSSVPARPGTQPWGALDLLLGLTGLAMLGLLPLTLARVKRYQHGHCQFAAETSRMTAPTPAFYRLALGVAGCGLVMALVLAPGLWLLAARPGWPGWLDGPGLDGPPRSVVLAAVAGCGLLVLVLHALLATGLQNLVWGHTRSPRMRFDSHLDTWRLLRLGLRNTALTALTLGAYRPFAVVHSTRLRLEAMQIVVRGDPCQWVDKPAHLAP